MGSVEYWQARAQEADAEIVSLEAERDCYRDKLVHALEENDIKEERAKRFGLKLDRYRALLRETLSRWSGRTGADYDWTRERLHHYGINQESLR